MKLIKSKNLCNTKLFYDEKKNKYFLKSDDINFDNLYILGGEKLALKYFRNAGKQIKSRNRKPYF